MMLIEEFSVTNARSGLSESPVVKPGDKNERRSAYIEQFEKDKGVLARKGSTRVVTLSVSTPFKIDCAPRDDMLKSFNI